jgi:hypothetical protein
MATLVEIHTKQGINRKVLLRIIDAKNQSSQ